MCDGGQKQQGFCLKRGKGKWLRNRRELGKEYEAAVRRILEKRGYRILRENYRCPIGEIDLIARDRKTLVFVEVKYRSSKRCGLPEEAVSVGKQRRISRTARWYLMEQGYADEVICRFDVAAVSKDGVRIYQNAFDCQS